MLKKLTNLSLALFAVQHAAADTAMDYLHRGAQKYIFGEKEKAKTEITTGLQKFPTDEPLQQMLALFREQQQKQQQEQDKQKQQDQKDQQNKDQQKQDQEQKQDGQKQGQQQKDDGGQEKKDDAGQQKSPPKDEKSEQKDGQQGQPTDGNEGAKPQDAPAQGDKKLSGDVKANPSQQQPEKPDAEAEAMAEQEAAEQGKMTERQAKALLESLKDEDERVRLLDPNERKRSGRVLRDW